MPKHHETRVRDVPRRFWAKVDKTEDCWLWTGAVNDFGYGKFHYFGMAERAHRVSYILAHGEVPPGMCVLHSCDNPLCVNPAHLRLGTKAENARDRTVRGRAPRGELASWAKLTTDDVLKIRQDTRPPTQVGKDYGVSRQTIYSIRKKNNWKHV